MELFLFRNKNLGQYRLLTQKRAKCISKSKQEQQKQYMKNAVKGKNIETEMMK